jgi:class 3 adenylate cyclase
MEKPSQPSNPVASPARKPMRIPYLVKVALATGLGFLILLSAASFTLYELAKRRIIEEFGQKLITVVVNGAKEIRGDQLESLTLPSQMKTQAYKDIRSILLRLKKTNSHVKLRYVYTMAPTQKPGVWRYVVDSTPPDSKDFSPLGSTEDFTYNPVWLKPLEEPIAEDQMRYYPGWGYFISASAPIFDRKGKSVGILSVDASAKTITDALEGFKRRALLCALAGFLLCVLLSLPLAWHVTRPLLSLTAGTREITEGNFDYRVPVKSNDEITDLSEAFNRMAQGLKERDLYKQQFSRYVSRQIADKILANPEKSFWSAERRRATVLFSDIRGFTSMSEKLPPEEVIARLNEYLALMIDIVFEHEGTLDKFMGDAVMAIFGAPVSFGNEEERAVKTAVDMQKAVKGLAARWAKRGFPDFRVGIGVHTGEIVVGNIGSEKRLEYGAIGDSVNLASRLESLTKDYKKGILISEVTYKAVKPMVKARFVDKVIVRGRTQPIGIYEVLGIREKKRTASKPKRGTGQKA